MHKNSFGYGVAKVAGFLMIFGGGGMFLFRLYILLFGGEPDISRIPWASFVTFAMVVQAGFCLLVWEPPGSLGTLQDLQQDTSYIVLHQELRVVTRPTPQGEKPFGTVLALVTSAIPPAAQSIQALLLNREHLLPQEFQVEKSGQGAYVARPVTD